ncbi:SDR family oxidoreductase (plasmid) [Rhodococcus sp. USK10]|nr:SDR family oxidoreductase [Rhodococcus sp. USK10]
MGWSRNPGQRRRTAWTETPALQNLNQLGGVDIETLSRKIPMGRLGQPADVSAAIAFFLSAESTFITGQTLYVDGGYTAAG